ncbi:short chain dehydrogenase family protein [Hyaloraphidium curvatum]|nr:short chain dehydrogenase family protein [Hyaloraphidium curvatum]
MPPSLANTVAVVTGGANGIGLACAREYALLGADIVLGDVDAAALAKAKESLLSTGRRVDTVVCDVTSDADNARLAEAALRLGPVGVLMLNAGISSGGRLELVPTAQWEKLLAVNVLGVVRGLSAFFPHLKPGAHVVITGSSSSFDCAPDGMDAPYVSSKHAVLGLVKGYAAYLSRRGVGVQMLAPKMTDTAFPRSTVAWGARGPRVAKDREVPADADTAEEVARIMARNLGNGRMVVSADPGLPGKLETFARENITAVNPKL